MEIIEKAKKKNEHLKEIGIYEIISLVFSMAFAFYNFYLGVFHRIIWNFSVSFYCFLILLAKTVSIIALFGARKENKEFPKNIFIFVSILLVLVTLAMIIPANLMLKNYRKINIGTFPIIIIACFVVARVCYLIHLFITLNNEFSLFYQLKIALNISATIFSLLTLQNTIMFINGSASEKTILLSTISTNILLILAFVISIFSLIKGINHTK